MATLLGDMRSGHSQWSRDASRNCLAADLYLGNSNEQKFAFVRNEVQVDRLQQGPKYTAKIKL